MRLGRCNEDDAHGYIVETQAKEIRLGMEPPTTAVVSAFVAAIHASASACCCGVPMDFEEQVLAGVMAQMTQIDDDHVMCAFGRIAMNLMRLADQEIGIVRTKDGELHIVGADTVHAMMESRKRRANGAEPGGMIEEVIDDDMG